VNGHIHHSLQNVGTLCVAVESRQLIAKTANERRRLSDSREALTLYFILHTRSPRKYLPPLEANHSSSDNTR
jgi:hypothetical protein